MNPENVCYGCFQEKKPGNFCPHCGFNENEEMPYLALPLGTILNGRYLVGKVLGIGGFGITYLGYDLTLEIKVAIKEYMPSALATRHADHYNVALTGKAEKDYQYGMEKFLEEAKVLAKLQNMPNVVSVQNYFKENNTAYFVMEYVDGMSLKEYLASHGDRIPYTQALDILRPVMEVLVHVHSMNLLHRDISPDNIYITSKGETRLLDFGAARFATGDSKSVSVILKHGYAPEEQYSSHGNQGPWTDVYAMGATIYRCITGVLPPDSVERFHGDTMKRPSELGVYIPENVEDAVITALAVRIEDRFQSMSAFLGALDGTVPARARYGDDGIQPTQAAVYGQPAYVHSAAEPVNMEASPPSDSSGRKKKTLLACALGTGVLAVIALCIILPIVLSGGKNRTDEAEGVETVAGADTETPPEQGEGADPETPPEQGEGDDTSDYTSYTSEKAGIQVTIDNSLVSGGVYEEQKDSGYVLYLYPLADTKAAFVTAAEASVYGLSTPDEAIEYFADGLTYSGGSEGELYTVPTNGVEWLCQNFVMPENDTCVVASGEVNGICYVVMCVTDPANEDITLALGDNVLQSIQPWN